MLNCLCAIRIGLGWAHDVFKLACHMFMHTYLYFVTFLYTVVLVLFWLSHSLSLSLSLFLALVCSMAPKCKSTPSQNPLCSGASSSFDPTPSVQFHDDEAQKDFLENFCRRGIHLECHVILLDFSDINLPTVIHSRGWESLYGILATCPSMIIQEFYSNMNRFDYSIL